MTSSTECDQQRGPVASADELQLIASLREGDERAFAELVDRYHAMLLRLARGYVGSSAAAEDVVQETWMGVLKGIHRFEGRSTLRTWICHILMNRARTRRRELNTVPFSALEDTGQFSDEPAVDPQRFRADGHWLVPPCAVDDRPEDRLMAAEFVARVRVAVDGLPQAQREVVTLRDIHDWSATEVCSLLGITDANQRVLLHRGRSKVRLSVEEYVASEHTVGVFA